jgi:hypothetical protein
MHIEAKEFTQKNEYKKTICLNMIVKDESHIIETTLNNIVENINIDYWVISDTGSTDNTKDIITNFFKNKNIEGELYDDKWEDFGHNRSLALDHAFNKSDYLFIFDADDLIHGKIPIPNNFDKNGYFLSFPGYHRMCLVSNRHKWSYVGVVHEVIEARDFVPTTEYLNGNYYIQSRRLGSRNKNPNKYIDDGLLLEKAIEKETKIGLKNRYIFYAAQSFMDKKEYYDKAIDYLKLFLNSNGDNQHKFICCTRLAHLYKEKQNIELFILYNNKSIEYDNNRLEGIVMNMEYFYNNSCHHSVNMYYNYFKNYQLGNSNLKLFYDHSKYEYFYYLNSISASYVVHRESGYDCCKKILLMDVARMIGITIYNFTFYKEYFYQDNDNNDLIKWFINFVKNPTNDLNERKKVLNEYCQNPLIRNKFPNDFSQLDTLINTPNNIFKCNNLCKNNNILIYTGYMYFPWNDSTLKTQSIGGAEKAVIYLSRKLPKNYNIYIAGDQLEEKIDNITYIHHNNLQKFLNTNEFNTIIVSRYISFFKEFNNLKCFQLFLSAHDSTGFINNHVRDLSVNDILNQYDKYIDKVVCLTNWHANNIID